MGFTPLTSAVDHRHIPVAKFLLESGADVELPVECPLPTNFNGASPLMIACRQGPLEMVELLLSRGADPNRRNRLWHIDSTLRNAVHSRDVTIVRRLLKAGAKPHASHLYSSVIHGPSDVVEELIKAGCDVAYISKSGQPTIAAAVPMGTAAIERGKTIIQLLLNAGADLNAEGKGGQTALMKAVRYNLPSMIEFLIARGAKVDRPVRNDQSTALHCAAELGHVEATETLIKLGAPFNARDKRGRTPFDLAKAEGQKGVLKLLKNPPV